MMKKVILFLLVSLLLVASVVAVGEGIGCTPGSGDLCDPGLFCPSQDFGTSSQDVCSERLLNYVWCNVDEPADVIHRQCASVNNVVGKCLLVEENYGGNDVHGTHSFDVGYSYCLPLLLNLGDQCYHDTQCSGNTICDLDLSGSSNNGNRICFPAQIQSGDVCHYDRQCGSYSSDRNTDACADGNDDHDTYVDSTCRLGLSDFDLLLSVRSDLLGNINPTPETTNDISVYVGETIELAWDVKADTLLRGQISCIGTSNNGNWGFELNDWSAPDDEAPIPLFEGQSVNAQLIEVSRRFTINQETTFTFSCTQGGQTESSEITVRTRGPRQACDYVRYENCLVINHDFESGVISSTDSLECVDSFNCIPNKLGDYKHLGMSSTMGEVTTNEGNYYVIDDLGEYFYLPFDLSDPTFQDGFSISYWVKPGSIWAEDQNLFHLIDTGGPEIVFSKLQNNLVLGILQNNLVLGITGFRDFPLSNDLLHLDKWNNVILAYDNGELNFYLNGNLEVRENINLDSFQFRIGDDDAFSLGIDEVKVYNTPLDLTQAALIYQARDGLEATNNYYCTGLPLNSELCQRGGTLNSGSPISLLGGFSDYCPIGSSPEFTGCWIKCPVGTYLSGDVCVAGSNDAIDHHYTFNDNDPNGRWDGSVNPTANRGLDSGISSGGYFVNNEGYLRRWQPAFNIEDLTVSMWIKPDDLDAVNKGFFQWARNNMPFDPYPFLLIRQQSANVQFYVDGDYQFATTNDPLDDNGWHHVAVTKQGSNYDFYIDGELVEGYSDSDNSNTYRIHANSFFLGTGYSDRSGSPLEESYNGNIDEVVIKNEFTSDVRTQLYDPVVAQMLCGNGVIDSPEQCDDGNNIDGDGCSATCQDEFPVSPPPPPPAPPPEPRVYSPGDLNGDFIMTMVDAHLLMSRRMSGQSQPSIAEDVDCNDNYDYKDVLKLVDVIVGDSSVDELVQGGFYTRQIDNWVCAR